MSFNTSFYSYRDDITDEIIFQSLQKLQEYETSFKLRIASKSPSKTDSEWIIFEESEEVPLWIDLRPFSAQQHAWSFEEPTPRWVVNLNWSGSGVFHHWAAALLPTLFFTDLKPGIFYDRQQDRMYTVAADYQDQLPKLISSELYKQLKKMNLATEDNQLIFL